MPLHDTKTGRILPDPRTTEERFWSKVDRRGPDECWFWKAGLNRGYGAFWLGGNNKPASRMAYVFTYGPIPDELLVCHSCDARYETTDPTYKKCCNPHHLFLGTPDDNAKDTARKGRTALGDRHHSVTHPEWLARGEKSGAKKHPERIPRGERAGLAKLTESQVIDIRQRYAARTAVQTELAREFGVRQTTISMILSRKTWTHIP